MKLNTQAIALKLVHMMVCNGLIDQSIYLQILNRYGWLVKDDSTAIHILNKRGFPRYTLSKKEEFPCMEHNNDTLEISR